MNKIITIEQTKPRFESIQSDTGRSIVLAHKDVREAVFAPQTEQNQLSDGYMSIYNSLLRFTHSLLDSKISKEISRNLHDNIPLTNGLLSIVIKDKPKGNMGFTPDNMELCATALCLANEWENIPKKDKEIAYERKKVIWKQFTKLLEWYEIPANKLYKKEKNIINYSQIHHKYWFKINEILGNTEQSWDWLEENGYIKDGILTIPIPQESNNPEILTTHKIYDSLYDAQNIPQQYRIFPEAIAFSPSQYHSRAVVYLHKNASAITMAHEQNHVRFLMSGKGGFYQTALEEAFTETKAHLDIYGSIKESERHYLYSTKIVEMIMNDSLPLFQIMLNRYVNKTPQNSLEYVSNTIKKLGIQGFLLLQFLDVHPESLTIAQIDQKLKSEGTYVPSRFIQIYGHQYRILRQKKGLNYHEYRDKLDTALQILQAKYPDIHKKIISEIDMFEVFIILNPQLYGQIQREIEAKTVSSDRLGALFYTQIFEQKRKSLNYKDYKKEFTKSMEIVKNLAPGLHAYLVNHPDEINELELARNPFMYKDRCERETIERVQDNVHIALRQFFHSLDFNPEKVEAAKQQLYEFITSAMKEDPTQYKDPNGGYRFTDLWFHFYTHNMKNDHNQRINVFSDQNTYEILGWLYSYSELYDSTTIYSELTIPFATTLFNILPSTDIFSEEQYKYYRQVVKLQRELELLRGKAS